MGTRNLTLVKQNNETKIAQYGQWDGYPSGQGVTILDFLQNNNEDNYFDFRERVSKLNWITDEQSKEIDKDKNWTSHYPYLSRNAGGEILNMIMNSDIIGLVNSEEFAADSLFCEWAYVIDLDKNTFEVYQGFNKKPIDKTERFFYLTEKCDNNYYPVRFIKEFDINNLPTKTDFINYFREDDEDDTD